MNSPELNHEPAHSTNRERPSAEIVLIAIVGLLAAFLANLVGGALLLGGLGAVEADENPLNVIRKGRQP